MFNTRLFITADQLSNENDREKFEYHGVFDRKLRKIFATIFFDQLIQVQWSTSFLYSSTFEQ